jgi:RNA polymerase sigma factor (TIGR02999 family)
MADTHRSRIPADDRLRQRFAAPPPGPTMSDERTCHVVDLLARSRGGDQAAFAELYDFLYQDLRRLARAKLRSHQPLTLLDTTALVHESFLRLVGAEQLAVADRHHFFAFAARVMRSVIIDFLRRKQAERRGGGVLRVTLDEQVAETVADGEDEVIRVAEALQELEAVDGRAVQVVEMRYFAGMTEAEIAAALGVTERTVRRDWQKAKLLLQSLLG